MEKTGKDGKTASGKIARQVTTLKTTLKHTTDNAASLDKSIKERMRESEELMQRLEIAEAETRQKEQNLFNFQMENVLGKKIQRQVRQSKLMMLQQETKAYEDLSAGKYKPIANIETLKTQLNAEKAQGEKLDAILKEFVESKPEYRELVSMLIDWE
jgi:predicted RNase H-like nuclease (RuvC/YqgF family)